jgi:hypothetical protein
MVRLATRLAVLLSLSILGCAAHGADQAKPAAPASREPQFANDEARMIACIELRDHIVDLYAGEYEERGMMTFTPEEREAFREGWAEELERRGTFERFARSCLLDLTPRKFECGMASKTPDRLVACMKLSRR